MRHSALCPAAVLASALVFGCGDQSGLTQASNDGPSATAAETTTDVEVIDVDFTDFVPCTGENVHWSGTLRLVVHSTINRGVVLPPDAAQHFTITVTGQLTGVGETSGGTYQLNDLVHQDVQSESPVNPFPGAVRILTRNLVIGPTGGAVGFATISIVAVLNGVGELVVDKEDVDFTMECL